VARFSEGGSPASGVAMGEPRLTVLVFLRHYLPGFHWGGPIRTISNMVDQVGEDIAFRIVTTDRDYGSPERFPDIRPGEWSPVGHASVLYVRHGGLTPHFVRHLLVTERHDVLYVNSFFDPRFSMLPVSMNRSLGIRAAPMIVAPRGEFSLGALALKHVRKRAFIGLGRASGLYRRVLWHASTELEAHDIRRELRGSAESIHVARNLAAAGGYPLDSDDRRPPVEAGVLRICFLSRVTPKKNLDYALRVLRRVSTRVDFSIYGPILDRTYWARCSALLEELPGNVRATYEGPVRPERVPRVIAANHLLFLPTRGESFGHVILESLSTGTPVLISDQTPWSSAGLGCRAISLDDLPKFADSIEETAAWTGEQFDRARREARRYGDGVGGGSEGVEATRALFRRAYEGFRRSSIASES